MKRISKRPEVETTTNDRGKGPATPGLLALLLAFLAFVGASSAGTAASPPSGEENPPIGAMVTESDLDPLGDPRFFIEAIEVAGLRRASPEILISESLLEPGHEYGESELRLAVYRVNRLPFVLEARFSLAKGSDRGRFRLIIEVDEVSRFFFGVDAGATVFTRDVSLDDLRPVDFTDHRDALAGARFFMGQYGTFFTAVTTNGSVQLGLTRYQVFGRRVFMSLGLVRQGCCPVTVFPLGLDPTFSRWSTDESSLRGTFTLGIPLGGNHSLRFEAWRFDTNGSGAFQGNRSQVIGNGFTPGGVLNTHDDLVDQAVELGWIYDSSDDPTFPTRGTTLSVTYQLRELRSDLFTDVGVVFDPVDGSIDLVPQGEQVDMRSQMHRLSATATRHWALAPRHVVSLALRVAVGRSDVANIPIGPDELLLGDDLDLFEGGLSLRHSTALWQGARHLKPRELRWETTLDLGWEQTSPTFGLSNNPLERRSLDSSLVFRNRWGIFRLGLSFVEVAG